MTFTCHAIAISSPKQRAASWSSVLLLRISDERQEFESKVPYLKQKISSVFGITLDLKTYLPELRLF